MADEEMRSWLWKDSYLPLLLALSVSSLAIPCFRWAIKRARPSFPPGPRGLPLLGYLPFIRPDLHVHLAELAQTYGAILSFRLGLKLCVVVTSPSLAKEILRDQDAVFANHNVPAASFTFSYGGVDILWSPNGAHWRMLRKVFARELLNGPRLNDLYELRRLEVRKTVGYFYSKIEMPVEVGVQASVTSMNVVMSMVWGGEMEGGGRSKEELKFLQIIEELVEISGRANISDYLPFLGRLDLQGVVRDAKKVTGWLDETFDSIIARRLERRSKEVGEKKKDFLQVLLELVDGSQESETPFTLIHLKALLMDIFVGGTETSSSLVEWAMTELMLHPGIMKRAQEEIDQIVGTNTTVEEFHLPHLPYLDAVLKEVLRLHPVAPLLIPRKPDRDTVVGQHLVPKGASVFVNVWAIHKDPLYWKNPLNFDPDRFFSSKEKWDLLGNDFRYLPFGSGRRVCPGVILGERMLSYVVASLLHSFDWSVPAGTKIDVAEKFGFELQKVVPLVAIPSARLLNPELYF